MEYVKQMRLVNQNAPRSILSHDSLKYYTLTSGIDENYGCWN